MSDLRWLLDNVPEDLIEEHAPTIEDAIKENAVLKDEIRRHEEVFQFSANKIAALKRENEHLAKVIDNVWTALNEAGTTVQGARGQMLADALLTTEEQE